MKTLNDIPPTKMLIERLAYFMLARILSSYAGYVKHVLMSEQKKTDFRPSEGGDADLFSCTQVSQVFTTKFHCDHSFRDPPSAEVIPTLCQSLQ